MPRNQDQIISSFSQSKRNTVTNSFAATGYEHDLPHNTNQALDEVVNRAPQVSLALGNIMHYSG